MSERDIFHTAPALFDPQRRAAVANRRGPRSNRRQPRARHPPKRWQTNSDPRPKRWQNKSLRLQSSVPTPVAIELGRHRGRPPIRSWHSPRPFHPAQSNSRHFASNQASTSPLFTAHATIALVFRCLATCSSNATNALVLRNDLNETGKMVYAPDLLLAP